MTLVVAWDIGDRVIIGADSSVESDGEIQLTKNKLWQPSMDVVLGMAGEAPMGWVFRHLSNPFDLPHAGPDEDWIHESFIKPTMEAIQPKDMVDGFEALIVAAGTIYIVSYPWDILENCGSKVVAIGSGRDAFLGAHRKYVSFRTLYPDLELPPGEGAMHGLMEIAAMVCPSVSAPFHTKEVLKP